MAKRLFESGNYVIVDDNGSKIQYQQNKSTYETTENGDYRIIQQGKLETLIESTDITNWITSESGSETYTEATLLTFLRTYTSFFLSSSSESIPYDVQLALGQITDSGLVNKFGYNPDIDNGQEEIIASFGGAFDPLTNVITTAQTFDITYNSGTDGDSTTGALSLLVTYIDSSFNEVSSVHVLGSTGSDTTSFSGYGINRCLVLSNGGDGFNNSDITIKATTDTTTQAFIPAESSVTQQMIYHTPISKNLLINHISINILKTSGGSTPKVTVKGYSWSRVTETRYEFFKKELDTGISNDLDPNFNQPIVTNGREVIYFTLETDQNNTSVNGRFGGYLIGN